MKTPSLPLVLLAIAAFLTPLIGGHVSTDSLPLVPGAGSTLIAMLGGPLLQGVELPILSHAVLGLLCLVAFGVVVARRQILQLPNNVISASLLLFFGMLMASIAFSAFKFVSLAAVAEWLMYGVAFFAVVATVGRKEGPLLIVSAFVAGCALVALLGVMEYNAIRAAEPSYRIFGGWSNPNALAGMLLIGLFLGIGLCSATDRVPSLVAGLGSVVIGFALVLTASKGAFVAAAVAAVVVLLLLATWKTRQVLPKGILVLVGVAVLAGAFQLRPAGPTQVPGASTPLARFGTGEAQEQSFGFRKLLYQGAASLIRSNVAGVGVGAYRYESARPGLTTQTHLTHNTPLQLAVEASPVAPLALLVALIMWFIQVFRSARSLPPEQNALRAGIVAAVVACLAHGMIESNLYYFGIGLAFFMLLGVGLLLSADAVAPEFTPKGARGLIAVTGSIAVVIALYTGIAEKMRANVRYLEAQRNVPAAKAVADSLVSLAPLDGESWYLKARYEDRAGRLESLKLAAEKSPSTKNLRAYAVALAEAGRDTDAIAELDAAARRDPNNLLTLKRALDLHVQAGRRADAERVARRMISVENTEYFKIRSLPQLVPTETAEARVYLANGADDVQRKIALLRPAVETYLQYLQQTVPQVKRLAEGGLRYGDQDPGTARETLQQGIDASRRLAEAYRAARDASGAEEAAGFEAALAAGLEDLGLR